MKKKGGPSPPSTYLTHIIMTPWTNRFAALALMAMVYALGYDIGRDATVQAHHNHPACHTNLKP